MGRRFLWTMTFRFRCVTGAGLRRGSTHLRSSTRLHDGAHRLACERGSYSNEARNTNRTMSFMTAVTYKAPPRAERIRMRRVRSTLGLIVPRPSGSSFIRNMLRSRPEPYVITF